MFRCHVIKQLSGYLDGQLSDSQKRRVRKHLQSCARCSDELKRLQALSEKLKAWHAPDLDAGFDTSVRNEIVRRELENREVKMKKSNLFILIPSSVLAGLLMCAFLGQTYFHRGLQGRYRTSSDDLGERLDAGKYSPYYAKRQNNVPASLSSRPSVTKGFLGEGRKKELAKVVSDGKNYYPQSAADEKARVGRESLEYDQKQVYADASLSSEGGGAGSYQRPAEGKRLAETSADNSSVIVIQPALPATGEGDKIIRAGTIKLEVENGKEAYKTASGICQELGGYMSSSNFYKDSEGRESGTITMRIPREKFTAALDRLSALGKVENIDTDSQDVSQQYANLKSELDAAMVIYSKMLEALQKKQVTIPDAIRIESELTPVLKRVQNYKNQLEALNNAISYTTVTVVFHESKISVKTLQESKKLIQESMLSAKIKSVKIIAQAIPNMVGFVFLFVIIVTIAFLIKYLIVNLFKRG
jgi:hypothetical protein